MIIENYPEEIDNLIEEILKDPILAEKQERLLTQWVKEKDPEIKRQLWKDFPGGKLAQIVIDYFNQILPEEKLAKRIKEDLMVSSFRAEEIARKLKMAYLSFLKSQAPKTSPSSPPQKSEQPQKTFHDRYREPIE